MSIWRKIIYSVLVGKITDRIRWISKFDYEKEHKFSVPTEHEDLRAMCNYATGRVPNGPEPTMLRDSPGSQFYYFQGICGFDNFGALVLRDPKESANIFGIFF